MPISANDNGGTSTKKKAGFGLGSPNATLAYNATEISVTRNVRRYKVTLVVSDQLGDRMFPTIMAS